MRPGRLRASRVLRRSLDHRHRSTYPGRNGSRAGAAEATIGCGDADLPRSDWCKRCGVRRDRPARADRRRLRGRTLRESGRCARHQPRIAVGRSRFTARPRWGHPRLRDAVGRGAGDGHRPWTGGPHRTVRLRVVARAGRAHLPVFGIDLGGDRPRYRAEPDPPLRGRDAQRAPHAGADDPRDAALAHPHREHGGGHAGGRDCDAGGAGVLQQPHPGQPARRLHGRQGARSPRSSTWTPGAMGRGRDGRINRPEGDEPVMGSATSDDTPGRLPAPEIRAMFDRIAPRYDLLNRVMTAGLDRQWREAAAAAADVAAGERAIDVCTGTGDLAFALQRRVTVSGHVVGADFAENMLERAREKAADRGAAVEFVEADALALPFADNAFDGATVAFGIRNVSDLSAGIAEMARVVRPGGRVVILEITTPRHLRRFY